MRKNTSRKTHESEKLSDLEKAVKEKLEKTGLVRHLRFRYGNLQNNTYQLQIPDEEVSDGLPMNINQTPDSESTYLEFRRNEETSLVQGSCTRLRNYVFEVLTRTVPEIIGMEYSQPYPNTFRAKPLINSLACIEDESNLYIRILSRLNDLLDSYLKREPLRKIR